MWPLRGQPAGSVATRDREVELPDGLATGCTSSNEAEEYLDETFEVPLLGDFEPLVTNVYHRLFDHHIARSKGRSIDKLLNLAKSVTVE